MYFFALLRIKYTTTSITNFDFIWFYAHPPTTPAKILFWWVLITLVCHTIRKICPTVVNGNTIRTHCIVVCHRLDDLSWRLKGFVFFANQYRLCRNRKTIIDSPGSWDKSFHDLSATINLRRLYLLNWIYPLVKDFKRLTGIEMLLLFRNVIFSIRVVTYS